ncbi:hypothetical protein ACNQ2O_03240 [Mycoplasma sp. AA7A]|uniref:hypothetical protein n=1 Tax=unclassified Mycoplasma TaxID=2683645 RepID=UPI003AB00FA4
MKIKNLMIGAVATSIILATSLSTSCGETTQNLKINSDLNKISGLNITIPNKVSNLYDLDTLSAVVKHLKTEKEVKTEELKSLKALIADMVIKNDDISTLSESDKIKAWSNINTINNFLEYWLYNINVSLTEAVPAQTPVVYDDINAFETNFKFDSRISVPRIYLSDLIAKNKINPYYYNTNDEFSLVDKTKHNIDINKESEKVIAALKLNREKLSQYQALSVVNQFPAYNLNWFKTMPINALFAKISSKFEYKPYWTAENDYYTSKFDNTVINIPNWYYNVKIKDNDLLTDLLQNKADYFSPLTYNVTAKKNINPVANISYQEVTPSKSAKFNLDKLSNTLSRYNVMKKYDPNLKLKYYKIDMKLNVSQKGNIPSVVIYPGHENQVFINYEPLIWAKKAGPNFATKTLLSYQEFKEKYQNVFQIQAARVLAQNSNTKFVDYLKALNTDIDTIYKADTLANESSDTLSFIVPIIDTGEPLEVYVNTQNTGITGNDILAISKKYNELANDNKNNKTLYAQFISKSFTPEQIGVNKYFITDYLNNSLLESLHISKSDNIEKIESEINLYQ